MDPSVRAFLDALAELVARRVVEDLRAQPQRDEKRPGENKIVKPISGQATSFGQNPEGHSATSSQQPKELPGVRRHRIDPNT